MSSKGISGYFFTSQGGGVFSCNLCGGTRKQQHNTGYTNLIGHLTARHPDYLTLWTASADRGQTTVFSERTMEIYKTAEWVIMRNHAEGEVDDPLTRSLFRFHPVTSRTLMQYLRQVTAVVGDKIALGLGSAFGIMFDEWTHGTFHYVGIYGVYEKDGVLHQPLLVVSPADDGQTADAHIATIETVLAVYNTTPSMLLFMVGDNCATNQTIASRMAIPLVGCASHCCNLAITRFLVQHQALIAEVQALVVQLRLPNNAAVLARFTDLKPVRADVTRWSSTYEMLKRYVAIRSAARQVPAVEELIPNPATHRRIVALVAELEDLDSVCIQLQRESCTLADARVLFDAVRAQYPIMGEYLQANARIVLPPAFENAVVKVEQNRPLFGAEESAISRFANTAAPPPTKKARNFAVDKLHEAKQPTTTVASSYDPLVMQIPPTSNRVERLFSQCKLVLTPLRSRLQPANFEMIMFLKANRELWGYADLARCNEEE